MAVTTPDSSPLATLRNQTNRATSIMPTSTTFWFRETSAELEKIAQQNRTEKGRLQAGVWKNHEFFAATSYPHSLKALNDADYQNQLAMLDKWIAAYPKSTAARISLAEFYVNYGDFARGTGYADSVSDSQWRLFHERTALAKQALLEAAAFPERDPYWYAAMQMVAHHEGWSKEQARDLLDQAIAFEPGYYHFYVDYAYYLLPQWYGEKGDIQAFAEKTSAQLLSPDNSIVYFQIMSSLACYCQESMEGLSQRLLPRTSRWLLQSLRAFTVLRT